MRGKHTLLQYLERAAGAILYDNQGLVGVDTGAEEHDQVGVPQPRQKVNLVAEQLPCLRAEHFLLLLGRGLLRNGGAREAISACASARTQFAKLLSVHDQTDSQAGNRERDTQSSDADEIIIKLANDQHAQHATGDK